MLNQSTDAKKVTDVIQVMKAGADFYQDAIKEIDDVHIKNTFRKMATNKKSAIEALQPYAIAAKGKIEDGSSIAVNSRKIYTKFTAMFSSNEDHTYIKQLEEVEDKVLETLDSAIKEDQPGDALLTLTNIRADAQLMHDEMKALQKITKH